MQGCPEDLVPEIALAGRSNAGKSSLINGLAKSRVAQVSSTPGKTRLLNFYEGPSYRIVDMPGYGFSSRAGSEQMSWQQMIEPYLSSRGALRGLLLVMDIRRDWTQDEEDLVRWLRPLRLPHIVVATKADKLSRTELLKRVKILEKDSKAALVLATSVLKDQGFIELEEAIFRLSQGNQDFGDLKGPKNRGPK